MPINPYHFDVTVEDGRVKVYAKKKSKKKTIEKKMKKKTYGLPSYIYLYIYVCLFQSYLEFRESSHIFCTQFWDD